MPIRHRTMTTIATAVIIAVLSVGFTRTTSIAQTQQGNPDVGAVTDIALHNQGSVILRGTKVQYTDNDFNVLGEANIGWACAFLLQPNNNITWVLSKKGVLHLVDATNKASPAYGGSWTFADNGSRPKAFVQLDDTTLVAVMERKGQNYVYTIDIANPGAINVEESQPDVETAAAGGGRMFGLLNGNLSELTPDGAGGYNKGPSVDTGGHTQVAVNDAGNKVATGGSNEMKIYDTSGATPTEAANRPLFGPVQFIKPTHDNQWIVVFDEFGSPRLEKLKLSSTVPYSLSEISFRYLRWAGTQARVATDPSDTSRVAVAKGDGAEYLRADSPRMASLATVAGLIFVHKMTLFGNLLYACGDVSGLWIWDMLNPQAPVFLDSFTFGLDPILCWLIFTSQGANPVSGAPAQDTYGIAAVAGGFNAYDLTDPTAPSFVDRLFTGGKMHDLAIQGDTAYGVADTLGLKIASLADPTNMTLSKTVTTPSAATRIVVTGNHAYVGTRSDGVRIIDVSVTATASEVGSITAGIREIKSVSTDGTNLYLGFDSTMSVYSLGSPTAPSFVGTYNFGDSATVCDIGVVDVPGGQISTLSPAATKLAYVAAGSAGFVVLDISNPATPTEVAWAPSRDFATSVAIDGNDVYMGDGAGGFQILDVDPTTTPVFFQRFDARASGRYVDISWEFTADEDLAGLEIFRAAGASATAEKIHLEGLLPPTLRGYRDDAVEAGRTYEYTMLVKTASGDVFRSTPARVSVPMRQASLRPNYPNPFNPSTTIAFDLPRAVHSTLAIYDVAGRHVVTLVDGRMPAGLNEVEWDGTNAQGEQVGSGIYVARLQADRSVQTIKLTLVK